MIEFLKSIHLDPGIPLGSMVHAAILVTVIWLCYRGGMKILRRVETKQDRLLDKINGKPK